MNFSYMDDTQDSIFFLEGTQRDGDVSLSPRDVPATPSRGGDDDFFEDRSIFSQSPNLFMTPGTGVSQPPGKREMTPSTEEALLFKSPEPGEKKKKVESPLFDVPGPAAYTTPLGKFSTTAPTPMMRSSTPAGFSKSERKISTTKEGSGHGKPVEVEAGRDQQQITPPPAERRKEAPNKLMEVQAQEVPPPLNLKELMESEMMKLRDCLVSLQSQQEQGGNQLLAQASAVQDEVSAYMEELSHKMEAMREHVNVALLNLLPLKPSTK